MVVKLKKFAVEGLTFVRGDDKATIATNGLRHITQEVTTIVKEHETLTRAIAYLEARGYSIDSSNFLTF